MTVRHIRDLGLSGIDVHNVGRNQAEFIRAYDERVVPRFKWPT